MPEDKKVMAVAITTYDNPYDPIDDFDQWFMYDEMNGYHTCSYLGRMLTTSDQLSDYENSLELERAVDRILAQDFQHIYKKIVREEPNDDDKKK